MMSAKAAAPGDNVIKMKKKLVGKKKDIRDEGEGGLDKMVKHQMDMDTITTAIIDKYFTHNQGQRMVKHQIESYNDFILRKLEQIIEGFNPIDIYHEYLPQHERFKYHMCIEIKNPVLNKPIIYEKDGSTKTMTPNDARQRNFTYAGNLNVNVNIRCETFDTETGEIHEDTKQINSVYITKLPIMVKSAYCVLNDIIAEDGSECKYDFGGYFIVNGNEKVVISQDRIAENKTYVFLNNKVSAYSHMAEIRSVQENKLGVPKVTSLKLSSKPNQFGRTIRANIHHIKADVPIFILFRALGLTSDKEIIEYIVHDIDEPRNQMIINSLHACIDEASEIKCQRDALEYLSRYLNINGYPREFLYNSLERMKILKNILTREFLPHVGDDFKKKALYLGYMVNKLLKCFLGLRDYDDRDSYINKRVDTPGILIASLFRQYYGKMIKDMKNMINKEINYGVWKRTNQFINIINKTNINNKIIKPNIIESGIRYALATGNWGIKNNKNKQGVAQVLNRMTYPSTLSHLRRINTPIEKSGKLVQPRKLHPTQWGVICPCETPEGASVGLVKNMAMSVNITIASNSDNIYDILLENGVKLFDPKNIRDMFHETKIILNGDFIGTHTNPKKLYDIVRRMKLEGYINIFTGIAWNIPEKQLEICTEGGRCSRPLYVVEEGNTISINNEVMELLEKPDTTWVDLMLKKPGLIEFVDVEESNVSLIAMNMETLAKNPTMKYTHAEIHPSLILGVLASCIPFSDHNQAPRNCYQASQGKQALGVYASNYRNRYDTMGHIMNYPQKPLVSTMISKYMNNDSLPSGINAIVAIATYTGFNQEDAVIMNQSAVDRGLYVTTYLKTYKEQNNKNHSNGEEEFFTKPVSDNGPKRPFNYDKLEDDGFVQENTYVKTGDVIIGKCMPTKTKTGITHKDNSVCLKNGEAGFVDRNCYNDRYFTNTNGEGYNFCKVRIRSQRVPMIGDKFSARSAQKGTVGMLYRQEDMPYTANGIVPDLIMNPHAIPSRMTIGQLLECILGKACVTEGKYGDATPFNKTDVEKIAQVLEDHGMERYGNEIMYDPRTGQQMQCDIFIGPTFYQRLKHMVLDKVHSRGNAGPVVMLTRQPAEGRARDGGLRIGEMELECNWAHGIFQFLKERLMECSDNYRLFTCKKCNNMAVVNPDKNIYKCNNCKNINHFGEVRIPYACKLFLQEIQTMGIGAKLITKT